MTYEALEAQARKRHLSILGGFNPAPDSDHLPTKTGTLLLLGPHEPGFWHAFTQSPEWQDPRPDPMDRWSERVIGDWALELGGTALYPFGGPPFLPFYTWALQTGRIHASPVNLLVHDTAGLLVSFRGALALTETIDLPAPPPAPCDSCESRPCLTACPVNALTESGYDVAACKGFLRTRAGDDCMTRGCAARRACPVSQDYPRVEAQSAFHMTVFRG